MSFWNEKATATIIFFDEKGKAKEEEMIADTQNQIDGNADLVKETLEKRWGTKVKWVRVDPISKDITLKAKIDLTFENEFINFLDNHPKKITYKRVPYTPTLIIWSLTCPYDVNVEELESLPYMLSVEDMPTVTLDF